MKIIGTDVSLNVCKAEGYLMVQFDARRKFNVNTQYRVFAYWPDYTIKDSNGEIKKGAKAVDTIVSFVELVEKYNANKSGLDSFAETDQHINFTNPTIYDLLNLASDINPYCGLD